MTSPSQQIDRHRTALHRAELSRPVRLAVENGLISEATSVFDYGCGRGGDVRRLQSRGISCAGWDPGHHPDAARVPSDVVNLGYVVNVIEDPDERVRALRQAWDLTTAVLIVSAQLTMDARATELRPYRDGCLTRLNTFQKYYQQQELREWIERNLGLSSVVPAAPGVFYAFRDADLAQRYLFSRLRRRIAVPRQRRADQLYERNRDAIRHLEVFFSDRGRLPEEHELDVAADIRESFGSLKRAFAVVRSVTGDETWEQIRKERQQDLLVYLALGKFEGRPAFSHLPQELQLDIRAHFSSYKNACTSADELLFSAGDAAAVDRACRRSTVGKQTPTALYFHIDILPRLEPILRVYEGCARAYVGSVEQANIIKMHRAKPQISYLSYPEFERDPHPALSESLKVRFRGLQIEYRDYSTSTNPFILHRKETFLPPDHPLWSKFERLTRQEERRGLFEDPQVIGTRHGWENELQKRGLKLRGHRVEQSGVTKP